MMRFLLCLSWAVAASLCVLTNASAADPVKSEDVRSFELTAVAPPTPALKYQLLFDNASERRPGNAAILYLQSILIMGAETKEKAQQALDAYDAGDMDGFNKLADSLQHPALFDELDLAGRREDCDWQPPIRERGVETLLPHLAQLRQGVAKAIKVRALRQIDQGKVEEALVTLRLGYELADKIGTEPVLISGLVSLAVTGTMNDGLARTMNRPESPNLYWALAEFPDRRKVFRRSYDGERRFLLVSVPHLAKWKDGSELTAAEWQDVLDYIGKFVPGEGEPALPDPIRGATTENLRQARSDYAAAHHLSVDKAAEIDPTVALGEYYYRQYELSGDEFYMLRAQPWSLLLTKSREFDERYERLQSEQPGNPFLHSLPQLAKVTWTFARADRELAALTAVEAIRSYAAAHDGKLPERLSDITVTPAPDNPATGLPFEYRVENGVATLGDSQAERPLTYTIRIRK
jgi:hypothetical protein